jgi:hypothetical protein
MTGFIDAVAGIGHNQPDPMEMEKKNQKWERWAKKRTFVRALEGTYSHLYKTLVDEPRVYSSSDVAWKGGPQMYGKSVIEARGHLDHQSINRISGLTPKTGAEARRIQQRGVLRAQGTADFRVVAGSRKAMTDAGRERRHQLQRLEDENACTLRGSKPLFVHDLLLQRWWNGRRSDPVDDKPYSPPTDI